MTLFHKVSRNSPGSFFSAELNSLQCFIKIKKVLTKKWGLLKKVETPISRFTSWALGDTGH